MNTLKILLGAAAMAIFAAPAAQAIDTVPLPEKPIARQVRKVTRPLASRRLVRNTQPRRNLGGLGQRAPRAPRVRR